MPPITRQNGGDHFGGGDESTTDNTKIVVTKAQWENLKARAAEFTKAKKELASAQKALKEQHKELEGNRVTITQLQESLIIKTKAFNEGKKKLEEMKVLLCKNGKVHKSELNSGLVDKTVEASKTCLFRNIKFVEDDEDLDEAVKLTVQYLPRGEEDLEELPLADYIYMYRESVNKGLQLGRQYVQSEGKKRAQGTLFCVRCSIFWE